MKNRKKNYPDISFEQFSKLDKYSVPFHNNFFTIFTGNCDYPKIEIKELELFQIDLKYIYAKLNSELLKIHLDNPKVIYYKKFQEQHPVLDSQLRSMIILYYQMRRIDILNQDINYQRLLYQAYLAMKKLGASEIELFR